MEDRVFLAQTAVILLSGKAGSGKTTAANYIKNYLDTHGYHSEIFSFASKVKEIAKLCGWDGKKDERGRKILQFIGNFGREVDEDFWAKHLLDEYNCTYSLPLDFIIIDDNRFQNEIDFFKNLLFQVYPIRVVSNLPTLEGELAKDISENSLPETKCSTLYNVGSLEELKLNAAGLTREILTIAVKF